MYSTVEPLDNGHPGDRVDWPLWRGDHCQEVKVRADLSTGTKICDRSREVAVVGGWPIEVLLN